MDLKSNNEKTIPIRKSTIIDEKNKTEITSTPSNVETPSTQSSNAVLSETKTQEKVEISIPLLNSTNKDENTTEITSPSSNV